jgi:hypothetical protein
MTVMRKRVQLRNRVREYCMLGSVRGQSGNRLSYRDGALQAKGICFAN